METVGNDRINISLSDKGYFAVLELRQFTIEGEVNQPVAKTIVP